MSVWSENNKLQGIQRHTPGFMVMKATTDSVVTASAMNNTVVITHPVSRG